jgi:hypothetical protein
VSRLAPLSVQRHTQLSLTTVSGNAHAVIWDYSAKILLSLILQPLPRVARPMGFPLLLNVQACVETMGQVGTLPPPQMGPQEVAAFALPAVCFAKIATSFALAAAGHVPLHSEAALVVQVVALAGVLARHKVALGKIFPLLLVVPSLAVRVAHLGLPRGLPMMISPSLAVCARDVGSIVKTTTPPA